MATDPFCSICSGLLRSSRGTKITEITEFLETFVQINCNLLEELLICDTCVTKVQSACKLKASYIENLQTLWIKQEDIENQTVCEICKESVNSNDCIPLFYSVTEVDKLNLIKFLSADLELKIQDSPQTCELCHKSIINFCSVMKSFSVFVQDKISNETLTDLKLENSNSSQDDVNSVYSTNDCKMDIKEENAEIKEDPEMTTSYEDFLCKNEELDLKTEGDPIWSYTGQEVEKITLSYDISTSDENDINLPAEGAQKIIMKPLKHSLGRHLDSHQKVHKCKSCDFQTTDERAFAQHTLIHKKSNKGKINKFSVFKCKICDFQGTLRDALTQHHKIHNKMFKCQICGYQTAKEDVFTRHSIKHNSANNVGMYICKICDYQTKTIQVFIQHTKTHQINIKNNKIKMLKCLFCDYQTKHQYSLKKHLVIHSETKMYKCQICNYQTRHKFSLMRHIQHNKHKSANANNVGMYICKICDYETKEIQVFIKHTKIH